MMDNDYIAEITRQRAAAETLRNIQISCPDGIPSGLPTWLAANWVVHAYLSATPTSSPFKAQAHTAPIDESPFRIPDGSE